MDFRDIGLTNRDKRIYETLLYHPQSSLRTIAELTGINRGTVFESAKDLLRAGLVTRIPVGKRFRYRAKDPEVLHEIIAEKRQLLKGLQEGLGEYINSFAGAGADPTEFHFASFYDGDEGTAAILRDVLKSCRRGGYTSYYVISSPRVSRYLYNNFQHFTRERIAQGIAVSVLRQGTPLTTEADYAESRYMGIRDGDSGCYTLIYGTKVAIITIDGINHTSGVIIDNENFARVQRMLFEATWSSASG